MSTTDFWANLAPAERDDMLCKAHPGIWAEKRRGFVNAPFHWEWYDIIMESSRTCIVAPREHAKSECISINYTCWACRYTPGMKALIFCNTAEQAERIKARIDLAMAHAEPQMMPSRDPAVAYTVFTNGSRIDVAGAGKSVRGEHPELIIGDDVLEEQACLSLLQRQATHRWWHGTVGGMAHGPDNTRVVGRQPIKMPATKLVLIGTGFHEADLLMSARKNPIYEYRRYAAEFDDSRLPIEGSVAVDAA